MSSFFYLPEIFFSGIFWNTFWIFYLRECAEKIFLARTSRKITCVKQFHFYAVRKLFSTSSKMQIYFLN